MSYQQLVQPNLATVGRIGYCLEYARKCFGAGVVEPNAWVAWQNTQFHHLDANIPADVCVPMWYSYINQGVNLGHVTISVPGKGIYSSPWQQGTDHAVLPSIAEVERIYGVKYVGWSEDISKVRVIKEQDMPTQKQVLDHFHAYDVLGKLPNGDPSQDQLDYYSTHDWSVLYSDLLNYNHDRRDELQAAASVKYAPVTEQLFTKLTKS